MMDGVMAGRYGRLDDGLDLVQLSGQPVGRGSGGSGWVLGVGRPM